MFERWLTRAVSTTSPLRTPIVLTLLVALASATIVLCAGALGHAAVDWHLRPRFEGPGGYPRIQQHPSEFTYLPGFSFHLVFFACFFLGTAVRMGAAIHRATDTEARHAVFRAGWWLTLLFFLALSEQYAAHRNCQVSGLYTVFVTSFVVLGLGARALTWGVVLWVRHEARRRSLDEWHRALRVFSALLLAMAALLYALTFQIGPDPNPAFERMVNHHLYAWGDGPLLLVGALFLLVSIPNEALRFWAARRLRAIRAGADLEFTLRPLRDDEAPPAALPSSMVKPLGIVRRYRDAYRQASEAAIASLD